MVADAAARESDRDPFFIGGPVQSAWSVWRDLAASEGPSHGLGAARRMLLSPLRFTVGLARRLSILLGPDTFVQQRLLASEVYPDLGRRARRSWGASLQIAFPLLITWLVIASVASRRLPPEFTWPALGLATTAMMFHTRTRFRVAFLPVLCVLAAVLIVDLPQLHLGESAILLTVLAGVVLFAPREEARPLGRVGVGGDTAQ